MSNYNLELNFRDDGDSKMPFPPVAQIYVQISTQKTGEDRRYISCDCMSAGELDSEVNRLIRELENIRVKGHKRFATKRREAQA